MWRAANCFRIRETIRKMPIGTSTAHWSNGLTRNEAEPLSPASKKYDQRRSSHPHIRRKSKSVTKKRLAVCEKYEAVLNKKYGDATANREASKAIRGV